MSFGFKHGPPRDADLAFDVRFLPNPHYEPELRPLTGHGRAGRRVHRPRRAPARSSTSGCDPLLDFLLPPVRRRGQGAPGGRDRLHRRAPPLGGDRRAPGRALPRSRRPHVAVNHRDIDKARATRNPRRDRPRRLRGLRPRALRRVLRRGVPRARWAPPARGQHAIAYGALGPQFWIVTRGRPRRPATATRAFARRRAAVDRRLPRPARGGGRDDGAPGLRTAIRAALLRRYVLDPDGLRVAQFVTRPRSGADSLRATATSARLLRLTGRLVGCPYGWESTASAGSAATSFAPRRRARRRHRVGRRQRPHRRAHARAPAPVRLDPRPLPGRRCERDERRDRRRRPRAEGARRARPGRAAVGASSGVDVVIESTGLLHRPRPAPPSTWPAAPRRSSSPRRRPAPT